MDNVSGIVLGSEQYAIANGMRVAAEQFDKHAAEFEHIAKVLRAGGKVPMFADGEGGARAADTLRIQFRNQAEEARRIMQMFGDATGIVVCTD